MPAADAFARTATHSILDAPLTDAGPHFRAGELVADSYIIRGVLGTGGMGQVYAADEVVLRRAVAIKTNREDREERLRAEAHALAQIHHRNVVAIHRFGHHRRVPFIAMERLYGRTLMEHMSARKVRDELTELEKAIELLCGIATGLDAIHAAGIAHLDLKPGNVILCADRVVLVDLGVMVPEIAAGPRDPCGTPLYMAPELIQAEQVPGQAHLADLYAFGAVAYELLTGAPMFADADPVHVLACQIVDDPPDVRELRPDVPARLADLIRACLAKAPRERPEAAQAIAWELRSIVTRLRRESGPLSVVRAGVR